MSFLLSLLDKDDGWKNVFIVLYSRGLPNSQSAMQEVWWNENVQSPRLSKGGGHWLAHSATPRL